MKLKKKNKKQEADYTIPGKEVSTKLELGNDYHVVEWQRTTRG